jgi:hypothetical protein
MIGSPPFVYTLSINSLACQGKNGDIDVLKSVAIFLLRNSSNVEISAIFGNDIGKRSHPRKDDQDSRFAEQSKPSLPVPGKGDQKKNQHQKKAEGPYNHIQFISRCDHHSLGDCH